jgi:hypothetical protein
MKTRNFISLLACLCLPMLGSLAQAEDSGPLVPLPAEDRAAIEQYLGKGVVGEAIPAPAVADTTSYLAARPGTRTFRLVSGDDAGKTEKHQLSKLKQEGGITTWRNESSKFVYYLTAKANGDYVVTGVEDKEGGAITRYSPSEPFMLQGLAPGEERNEKLDVKISDLSSPDDVSHEGVLNVNYRYIGAYNRHSAPPIQNWHTRRHSVRRAG